MAFSRTVRLAPVLLIPFFVAACVSQPGQKTEKPKPVAKTLTDGSPAILVTEDRSPQPRTATYSCGNGVTMTIENLGSSIRLVDSEGGGEEFLASPANQRSRFGVDHDAVVLDGRDALIMKSGHRPLTCKR